MTVTIQGYTTLTGRPETIIKLMQDARILEPEPSTPDAYIKSVQQTAWRCFGISLNVTGDSIEERAESLLRELAKNKLITLAE